MVDGSNMTFDERLKTALILKKMTCAALLTRGNYKGFSFSLIGHGRQAMDIADMDDAILEIYKGQDEADKIYLLTHGILDALYDPERFRPQAQEDYSITILAQPGDKAKAPIMIRLRTQQNKGAGHIEADIYDPNKATCQGQGYSPINSSEEVAQFRAKLEENFSYYVPRVNALKHQIG